MTVIGTAKMQMTVPTPLPVENRSTGRGPNKTATSDGTLPGQLRHDGFDLRLVKRVGRVALYEKTKGEYTCWEIILVRKRSGRLLPTGKFLPARECYPASSDWGIRGWTAMTLTRAKKRFNELLPRHAKSI